MILFLARNGSFLSLSQLSIKTRIETASLENLLSHDPVVWVSYPLKQGLKLEIYKRNICGKGRFESAIH